MRHFTFADHMDAFTCLDLLVVVIFTGAPNVLSVGASYGVQHADCLVVLPYQ